MYAKTLLIAFATTIVLALPACAQRQYNMLDEAFPVKDKTALKVAVSDADLNVTTGATREIRVQILVEARSEDRARSYFEAQQFDVALRDGEVQVLSEPKRGSRGYLRDEPEIKITVTTPRLLDLRLRTSDGDIVVGDVDGDVLVRTADGDIAAGVLTGTMFEARTSDGDITVESADFKNVVVETSDGDIGIGEAIAEEVTVHSSDGDIHVDQLTGITDIRTSDGDIHVGAVISSSSRIQTSDGDISLENVEGDLMARSSDGNLVVELVQPGTVTLRTIDGDVAVTLPADYATSLDLAATEIRMDCCASFDGRREEGRVEGHVNGGGARLQAETSDGIVYLREK